MMYKVLHILSSFAGGISSFVLNKALFLKDKDVIFDTISFHAPDQRQRQIIEATGGKCTVVSIPTKDGFSKFFHELNQYFSNNKNYEMVDCHLIDHQALPFYLVAKKHNIKRFNLHAHSTLGSFGKLKRKLRFALNNSIADQKISCGSLVTKAVFGEKALKNNEVMHIPNSINAKAFINAEPSKNTVLEKLRKDKDLIIGQVGRMTPNKNYSFTIKLAEKIKSENKNWALVFVGSGEQEAALKEEVEAKNLEDYIIFLGRQSSMPEIYQSFDRLLLPSLKEGYPTTIVESQAAGVPAIVSDTVTKEVDLNLGLVEFRPIEESQIDLWVDTIAKDFPIPDQEKRYKTLSMHKLTNSASAKLYYNFLTGKISHYNML